MSAQAEQMRGVTAKEVRWLRDAVVWLIVLSLVAVVDHPLWVVGLTLLVGLATGVVISYLPGCLVVLPYLVYVPFMLVEYTLRDLRWPHHPVVALFTYWLLIGAPPMIGSTGREYLQRWWRHGRVDDHRHR